MERMKTRIHRWLLGLTLLFLMPGTFLACLLLIGMIGSGFQHGFSARDFAAVPILLIPPLLVAWGFRLLIGLRQGVHPRLRHKLLAFYLAVSSYCAFWLFAPMSHENVEIVLFSTREQKRDRAHHLLPCGEQHDFDILMRHGSEQPERAIT